MLTPTLLLVKVLRADVGDDRAAGCVDGDAGAGQLAGGRAAGEGAPGHGQRPCSRCRSTRKLNRLPWTAVAPLLEIVELVTRKSLSVPELLVIWISNS